MCGGAAKASGIIPEESLYIDVRNVLCESFHRADLKVVFGRKMERYIKRHLKGLPGYFFHFSNSSY